MKRIYHPWHKWECFKAGFYETSAPEGVSAEDAERQYAIFLRDIPRFESALSRVLSEWPISCEHFLSNESINRIAWLGQSSMCISTGIPSIYRSGFQILSDQERIDANATAEKYLNRWLHEKENI